MALAVRGYIHTSAYMHISAHHIGHSSQHVINHALGCARAVVIRGQFCRLFGVGVKRLVHRIDFQGGITCFFFRNRERGEEGWGREILALLSFVCFENWRSTVIFVLKIGGRHA